MKKKKKSDITTINIRKDKISSSEHIPSAYEMV